MLLRDSASLRRHPLALAIFLALGGHVAAAQADNTGAAAQGVVFDIPAGPLARQLNLLASQAGLLIGGDATLTANKQSQAVNATSVEQALAQMLAGSGVEAVRTGEREFQLVRQAEAAAGAVTLGSTTISGQGLGDVTEGTGAYATSRSSTATKLPMSLRETPQSVTVVTRQRMDDQNMKNLDDVMRNATGITIIKNGSERSLYQARGQTVENLQIDGVPTNIGNPYSMDTISKPNTDIYDRVEVVRGATGLMEGAGNPSASINLIRKRPTAERQALIETSVGSWDDYKTMVDLSAPLNEAGTLRGRSIIS